MIAFTLAGCVSASGEEPDLRDPSILFQEGFEDGRLLERDWYDGKKFKVSGEAHAGSGCIEYHWKAGSI